MKKAILILNLGSPEKPTIISVWKFLTEFLNDKRVIDIPNLLRFILVNFIIIPKRVRNSTKEYKKLWENFGSSPLIHYTKELTLKLNQLDKKNFDFYFAMRYQNPSIKTVLNEIYKKNYNELIILPLYPQYASASTGSTIEKCFDVMKKWWNSPKIIIINNFYDDQNYIDCFADNIQKMNYQNYDHILFSYHGLPQKHVDKTYNDNTVCDDNDCEHGVTSKNKFCYKAMCYETSSLIAKKIGIKENDYTVTFQSRLDDKWLKPYTDKVMLDLIKFKKYRVLIVSPAFVSDCLETLIEIKNINKSEFINNGGIKFDLVPSLNDNDKWAEAILKMVKNAT